MKHKLKKESLDVIVQRITNDFEGVFLVDILQIAECVRGCGNMTLQEALQTECCRDVVKNVNWLFGYESEVQEVLDTIKDKLKKKVFDKDSSHVTIISAMAGYCALISVLEFNFNLGKWYEAFESCEGKRILECLEVFKRYCPNEINVKGFLEARRYIRLWDSTFNW